MTVRRTDVSTTIRTPASDTRPAGTKPAARPTSEAAASGAAVEPSSTFTTDALPGGPTVLSGISRAPSTASAGTAATAEVRDRPPEKERARYDYIVVGAGAGGAPLAARLAEQGYKVLVLEGGEDEHSPVSEVPALHGAASEDKDLLAYEEGYFVKHYTDEDKNRADPNYTPEKEGVFYPRGEGIGGSTRMNAQIFVRVDDVDWDNIAKLTGDPEWSAANMKQYLQKLENNEYRPVLELLHTVGKKLGIDALQNLGGHGFDGWLTTTRPDPRLLLDDKQLLRIVKETAKFSFKELGSLGDKVKRLLSLFDPNDDKTQGTEGLTITPLSVTKDGRRNGPRDRLLDVAEKHPDRLHIKAGAWVDSVVLNDDNEVTGVKYKTADGKTHVEHVKREAILSAGAFGTPELLMRSGIGPKEELAKLERHGVAPRVELPGVGKSLSDRYEVGVVVKMKDAFASLEGLGFKPDPSDPAYVEWKDKGEGLYATNGAVIAFQAKSDPRMDDPDLYIFGVPGRFEGYRPGYSTDAVADDKLFTWVILHENKGDKRGEVTVNPDDPTGKGWVNFQYHQEESPGDSQPLVEGIKMVRRLTERFGDLVEGEVWPGRDVDTDAELAAKVEKQSWGHHANGTAKMGAADDPMAVVDSNFKVRGTKGLRVVDAAVFPDNVGSFIVSGVMQIAEKAADDIVEDAVKEDAARKAETFNPLSIRLPR